VARRKLLLHWRIIILRWHSCGPPGRRPPRTLSAPWSRSCAELKHLRDDTKGCLVDMRVRRRACAAGGQHVSPVNQTVMNAHMSCRHTIPRWERRRTHSWISASARALPRSRVWAQPRRRAANSIARCVNESAAWERFFQGTVYHSVDDTATPTNCSRLRCAPLQHACGARVITTVLRWRVDARGRAERMESQEPSGPALGVTRELEPAGTPPSLRRGHSTDVRHPLRCHLRCGDQRHRCPQSHSQWPPSSSSVALRLGTVALVGWLVAPPRPEAASEPATACARDAPLACSLCGKDRCPRWCGRPRGVLINISAASVPGLL